MHLFSIPYFPVISLLLVVSFVLRQWGTFSSNLACKYIFTPLVTASITALAVLSMADDGITPYRVLILAALVFSLIADTMLMVVETDMMRYGIVYFLCAHVAYIAAFFLGYACEPWHAVPAVILAILVALFNLKIRGRTGGLDRPVLVYSAVIGAMLFFALSLAWREPVWKAIVAIAGAAFFMASDFLIVYLSFIRPHPRESVIVWFLYAPAQLFLALSCFA